MVLNKGDKIKLRASKIEVTIADTIYGKAKIKYPGLRGIETDWIECTELIKVADVPEGSTIGY